MTQPLSPGLPSHNIFSSNMSPIQADPGSTLLSPVMIPKRKRPEEADPVQIHTQPRKLHELNTDLPVAVKAILRHIPSAMTALQECQQPNTRYCRVFWTDCAKFAKDENVRVSAAVVYRDSESHWVDKPYRFSNKFKRSTEEAELFAIYKALKIACNESLAAGAGGGTLGVTRVLVYSDAFTCLDNIRKHRERRCSLPTRPALNAVREISNQIDTLQERGLLIQLRWVPSHCGVPGNMQADTVARYALGLSPNARKKGVQVMHFDKNSLQLGYQPKIGRISNDDVFKSEVVMS